MKILVISDSHGNLANLSHIMGFAKKFQADAVIHCGDWNTIESVDAVLSIGISLYTVIGNADIRQEVIQKLKNKSKKFGEEYMEFVVDGRKIGVTHKPSNNKEFFGGKKLDIIFNGHIHSKDENVINDVKIVRPGAVINGNNFAIYDTSTNKIEFIEDDKV